MRASPKNLLLVSIVLTVMATSLVHAGTLIASVNPVFAGGGILMSDGATQVPANNLSNPQAGGFVQIISDGSGNGIGAAQIGGTGLANPGDDVILGTLWAGYGTFDGQAWYNSPNMDDAARIVDGATIVFRHWDTASPDQVTTGDGSVPAPGSWYNDTVVVLPASGSGIYNVNVTTEAGGPILTSTQLIPEPTSIALFAIGLVVVGLRRRLHSS